MPSAGFLNLVSLVRFQPGAPPTFSLHLGLSRQEPPATCTPFVLPSAYPCLPVEPVAMSTSAEMVRCYEAAAL